MKAILNISGKLFACLGTATFMAKPNSCFGDRTQANFAAIPRLNKISFEESFLI